MKQHMVSAVNMQRQPQNQSHHKHYQDYNHDSMPYVDIYEPRKRSRRLNHLKPENDGLKPTPRPYKKVVIKKHTDYVQIFSTILGCLYIAMFLSFCLVIIHKIIND